MAESLREKFDRLREDLQDQIVSGVVNHFESQLRRILFQLREIKNSDDLLEVSKSTKSLSDELRNRSESWKQRYERGFGAKRT